MTITLSNSHRMALLDIVGEYLRAPQHVEVFYDALEQKETTPGELLRVLMGETRAVPPVTPPALKTCTCFGAWRALNPTCPMHGAVEQEPPQ